MFTPELPSDKPTWVSRCCPSECKGEGMDKAEAIAWLEGKRSMVNLIREDPYDTWEVRVAQADAAKTEQAYWVLRAHKDGLI